MFIRATITKPDGTTEEHTHNAERVTVEYTPPKKKGDAPTTARVVFENCPRDVPNMEEVHALIKAGKSPKLDDSPVTHAYEVEKDPNSEIRIRTMKPLK